MYLLPNLLELLKINESALYPEEIAKLIWKMN